MSTIRLPLMFIGSIGEMTLNTLFDLETPSSFINSAYLSRMEVPVKLGRARKLIISGDDHSILIEKVVRLDFYINDILLSDEFFIVPGLHEEAIIGAATMRKWRMRPDLLNNTIIVDPGVARHQLIELKFLFS